MVQGSPGALVELPSQWFFKPANSYVIYPSGDTSGNTDYTNITSCFNTVSGITGPGGKAIYFAGGQWYINAKVVFVITEYNLLYPIQLIGIGYVNIQQTQDNTGNMELQFTYGSTSASNYGAVRNFMYSWKNQQTASMTNSVCLGMRALIGSTNTSAFGPQNWEFTDLQFQGGNRGWSITETVVPFEVSGAHFSRCHSNLLAGAAIHWVSNGGGGQPSGSIEYSIFAQPYTGGGGGIAPYEPLINVSNCENLVFLGVEVLNVQNQQTYNVLSCDNVNWISCKNEQSVYTGNNTGGTIPIINASNSSGCIDYTLNGEFIGLGGEYPPTFLKLSNTSTGGSTMVIKQLVIGSADAWPGSTDRTQPTLAGTATFGIYNPQIGIYNCQFLPGQQITFTTTVGNISSANTYTVVTSVLTATQSYFTISLSGTGVTPSMTGMSDCHVVYGTLYLAQSSAASTGMVQVLSAPSIQDGSGSLAYTFSYCNSGNSGNSQDQIQFVRNPGGITGADQSNSTFTVLGQTQPEICLINKLLTGPMTITFGSSGTYEDNYTQGMRVRVVVTAAAGAGGGTGGANVVNIAGGGAPTTKTISATGWSEWTYTGSIAGWVETGFGSL